MLAPPLPPLPEPVPTAHVAQSACADADATSGASRQARAVVCLLNEVRAQYGLSRVRPNARLARAARRHARDMTRRDYFDHTSPSGSTPSRRARRVGYRSSFLGEVISFGYDEDGTPRGTLRRWLDSPPHRSIILRSGLRDAGAGVSDSSPLAGYDGGATFVVDVGG